MCDTELNDTVVDTSTQNELNLIDNLSLNDVKTYLNVSDNKKLLSKMNDTVSKQDIKLNKKKSTRKKRYKFTHLSRTQRLKLEMRRLNLMKGKEEQDETINEEKLSDKEQENDEEQDDSMNDSLTTNQYLIQGKKIELTRSDYNRFIVHGKWRPAEFFRVKQQETTSRCVFCGFKSKTHIENQSICFHCRNFAHISLIKHHMFVCKDISREPNGHCKFKRLSNTTLQALEQDKIYCRYCHFNLIVNTLPSLSRLQTYLVQFVNNRVIYVNSASKKTMLWKTRLDLNKSDTKKTSISSTPKLVKPSLKVPKFIEQNEKENNPDNETTERPNRGPRVKHVSRSQPLYLQPVDNIKKQTTLNNKFYNELKLINDDDKPVFITWQSFTSDLKTEFVLSALPEKHKMSLYKTYEFKFTEIPNTKTSSEDLIPHEVKKEIEESVVKPFRAKIRKTGPRIESLDPISAVKSTFDWDDFFERNHRISSNQNFRLSCLNQNGKETYVPKNMSLVKNTQVLNQPEPDSSITSKRFTCKLNSYKDRFQQLNLDSLNDRLKESISQLNNDLVSNDKNNNSNVSTNKNILINSNDFFQTASTSIITNNNTTQSNGSNTLAIPFPFVIPDYLVWDNNVINKYKDIPKTGFSVISYSPYSIKSLCYLCGSTPEQENNFYYCSVCCEPYHEHCLSSSQKPKADSILIDWLCPSCKYCELCHLVTEDLQYCFQCNDSYHFDCLKKSSYPRKISKKRKLWLCFKCFECKICESKSVFYEKKVYNRMNNYDYNSCFKCYEKYELDKPFKCCNQLFNDSIQNIEKVEISKFIFRCSTCQNYLHYECHMLSDLEVDLINSSGMTLTCKSCDPENIKQQIESEKVRVFQEIFNSSAEALVTDYDKKQLDYLESLVDCPQIDLIKLIDEFYAILKNGLECEQTRRELKSKISSLLDQKYKFLSEHLKSSEIFELVSEPIEEVKEEEQVVENIETVEPKPKSEHEIQIEQELLEQTKKNFIFSDLIKAPHEDHTYSISSNSIALALQSSDIFNENLTLDKLNSFLDRIKECQMNPTLQKIFNSHFAPLTALSGTNTNSPCVNPVPKQEKPLKKSEKPDKPETTNIDFNDLDLVFSNLKVDTVDSRECLACRLIGDDDICGRLIPFDGYWIHMNCLLWSDDVLIDDCVIEQILSVFQKTKTICCYCKRDGATMSCYNKSCNQSYHFTCAYESKCFISDDLSKVITDKRMKTLGYYIFCPEHASQQNLEIDENFVKNMKYKKSVFIDLHDDNYRRKYSFPKFSLKPPKQKPYILLGSLQVDNLGDLETLSDYKDFLCPVDYECSRLFWSTNELGKKVMYKCRIRLLNDYKNDLERSQDHNESYENQNKSLDTSDIKFYLENFVDEKEESLTSKLNEDINLNLLSQVDGLNDLNVVNTNKNVIKFSNMNGGVTLVRPPQTTIKLPGLSTPGFNPNPTLNPDNKPKVLKLEASNIKFQNVRTTFVRLPNPPTFTSEIFMNKNLMLNLNQIKNENTLSPRSDRSDSSLNLNHSSNIVNPLQSSFDDMAHDTNSLLKDQMLESKKERKEKKDKIPKVKKEKIAKEKKPKKMKQESLSTKCTVAALLNAFHKVEKPNDFLPSNSDLSNDQTSNNSNSNPSQLIPTESTMSPLTIQTQNLNDSFSNFDFFIKKREKKTSVSSAPRVKNKLRDYFKDEFDMKVSFTSSLASNTPSLTIPVQAPEPTLSSLNSIEPLLGKPLRKKDLIEAKRLEKKMKKKEAKILKAKAKLVAMSEKKRLKLAKKLSVQSSLLDDQLFQQYAKTSTTSSSNRCIINNYYNDLDMDNINTNKLVFEITCEDGLKVISHDLNKAWKVIFDKVRKLRQDYKLKTISYKNMNGAKMYGLNSTGVIYMLEQLDSIQFCPLYKTKYIHSQNINDKWIINLNNCARTMKQHDGSKKCLDPFYWLASEHRSLNFLNLNQRFDQKFFQAAKALQSLDICTQTKYRHLKDFSKNALVVKRSPIHGRGLFTLVDLNQSQMIIEYSGEIIRNELCDKREKFYESKSIGCYMFRIDEFEVIDATTKGNQARFINHSCEPNCISRVLVIGGHKHIVIFAQRAISRGEELTYDYKFPKEDVKIKCFCKSSKCRKYLN